MSTSPQQDRPFCDMTAFTANEAAWLETVFRMLESVKGGPMAGFLPALAETGCRIVKANIPGIGGYAPYDRAAGGVDNRLILGPEALADERTLFKTIVHEGIHALQNSHCAALYAIPHNQRTTILLCPRDYIYAAELCERDAYAKEALADLVREQLRRSAGAAAVPLEKLGMSTFRLAFFMQGEEMGAALRRTGAYIMENCRGHIAADQPGADALLSGAPLKDMYNYKDMTAYFSILKYRKAEVAAGSLTFTRLEDEDILSIGQTCRVNPFHDGEAPDAPLRPELRTPAAIDPDLEELLDELNEKLGIRDADALPSFGTALKAQGIDRETFLRTARRPPDAPKTLAPGPKPA